MPVVFHLKVTFFAAQLENRNQSGILSILLPDVVFLEGLINTIGRTMARTRARIMIVANAIVRHLWIHLKRDHSSIERIATNENSLVLRCFFLQRSMMLICCQTFLIGGGRFTRKGFLRIFVPLWDEREKAENRCVTSRRRILTSSGETRWL